MAALAYYLGFRIGGIIANQGGGADPNAGFLSNNNIWDDTDFWDDTRVTG